MGVQCRTHSPPIDMSSIDALAPPLYNPTGLPHPDELSQTALDNCGLVSTFGATALQPETLAGLIDRRTESGDHTVLLQVPVIDGDGHAVRRPIRVTVTPPELADNYARRGASAVDELGPSAPSWPAVLETAAAKLRDTNPADGLDEGYARLDHITQPEALMMVTGRLIDTERSVIPGMLPRPPGPKPEEALYANARRSLRQGSPVLISTADQGNSGRCVAPRPPMTRAALVPNDGLQDKHAYFVVGTHRNDGGEPMFVVHNTATHNIDGEAPDTPSPTMAVPVRTLLDAGDAILFTGAKLPEEPREPAPKIKPTDF